MDTEVTGHLFILAKYKVGVRGNIVQMGYPKALSMGLGDFIIRCSKCDQPAIQVDLLTSPTLTLCDKHAKEEKTVST